MKNIIKLTGLIVLIAFSFFYTDRVVSVIRNTDPLLEEIENSKETYEKKAINGTIKGNSIIPGISGREINVDKSYKKMREKGIFDEKLLEYNIISPEVSLAKNKDKFIIKGNSSKKMVSLIFILTENKYLKSLEEIVTSKEVKINYFVSYDYLVNNSTSITKMNNREFYNYGTNGKYTPDNLIFANNLLSRITNNNAIYCLTKNMDKNILKMCSNNELYTINPDIIVKNNPYGQIKANVTNGSVILMEMNNNTTTEIGIIVDYLRGKGFKIVPLSELLNENMS